MIRVFVLLLLSSVVSFGQRALSLRESDGSPLNLTNASAFRAAIGVSNVTVLHYGAKGDGVTDDTDALQAAADAGLVSVPAGAVCVSRQITLRAPRVLVEGPGKIVAKAGLNADLFFCDGTTNGGVGIAGSYFRFHKITLFGSKSVNTNGCAIRLRNASYSSVTDCEIWHFAGSGIVIENYNASGDSDEINIVNNRVFGNGQHGLEFVSTDAGSGRQYPGDHIVEQNHLNYNTLDGINADGGYALTIRGNNILSNQRYGAYLLAVSRTVFEGNQVRANVRAGLKWYGEPSFWRQAADNLIAQNQFHYNCAGATNNAQVDLWTNVNTRFVGNYVGDQAFTPPRANYGLQVAYSSGVRISDNVLEAINHPATITSSTYEAVGNVGLADTSLVSPLAYGAYGDGTHDDTTAVQACANANPYLYLPKGKTFLISGVNIQNRYWDNGLFGYHVFGGGKLKQKAGSSQTLLFFSRCDELSVSDIELDGNKGNQTSANYGIYAVNVNYSTFRNLLVHDTKGTGFVVASYDDPGVEESLYCDEIEISDTKILFAGGYGLYIQGCGDHGIRGCHIGWNAWDNVYLTATYTVSIQGNHILSATQSGIVVANSSQTIIGGNMIRENKRHGVRLSGAYDSIVSDNRISWNGIETGTNAPLYSGISAVNSTNVVVSGNQANDNSFTEYWPVSGRSRQVYGLAATNCQQWLIVGNKFETNYTASTYFTGSTFKASANYGLLDSGAGITTNFTTSSPVTWAVTNGAIGGVSY